MPFVVSERIFPKGLLSRRAFSPRKGLLSPKGSSLPEGNLLEHWERNGVPPVVTEATMSKACFESEA
jgi:hypothetical protein